MVTWEEKRQRFGYTPMYPSPVTAPGAVTTDVCDHCGAAPGGWCRREVYGGPCADADRPQPTRYPPPAHADLVTLWKRGREPVLSITADGKVHDFHLPPARLAVLLREVADMLSENTILQ